MNQYQNFKKEKTGFAFKIKTQHENIQQSQLEKVRVFSGMLEKTLETIKTKKNTYVSNVICKDVDNFSQSF